MPSSTSLRCVICRSRHLRRYMHEGKYLASAVCHGWRSCTAKWPDVARCEAGAEMGLARARDGAWRSQGLLMLLMMMILRLPAAAELRGIGGGQHAGGLERICM